jgi:type III secretory pathway component EscT
MTAIAVGYAVYDIKTSTGWFAGIIGALILMLVVPVLVVLLLGDFVVWFIRRKNNSVNPMS